MNLTCPKCENDVVMLLYANPEREAAEHKTMCTARKHTRTDEHQDCMCERCNYKWEADCAGAAADSCSDDSPAIRSCPAIPNQGAHNDEAWVIERRASLEQEAVWTFEDIKHYEDSADEHIECKRLDEPLVEFKKTRWVPADAISDAAQGRPCAMCRTDTRESKRRHLLELGEHRMDLCGTCYEAMRESFAKKPGNYDFVKRGEFENTSADAQNREESEWREVLADVRAGPDKGKLSTEGCGDHYKQYASWKPREKRQTYCGKEIEPIPADKQNCKICAYAENEDAADIPRCKQCQYVIGSGFTRWEPKPIHVRFTHSEQTMKLKRDETGEYSGHIGGIDIGEAVEFYRKMHGEPDFWVPWDQRCETYVWDQVKSTSALVWANLLGYKPDASEQQQLEASGWKVLPVFVGATKE